MTIKRILPGKRTGATGKRRSAAERRRDANGGVVLAAIGLAMTAAAVADWPGPRERLGPVGALLLPLVTSSLAGIGAITALRFRLPDDPRQARMERYLKRLAIGYVVVWPVFFLSIALS